MEQIQNLVASATPEEREKAAKGAVHTLKVVGQLMQRDGSIDAQFAKEADLSIEVLVRIESVETGAGWFRRWHRRISLARHYLKP